MSTRPGGALPFYHPPQMTRGGGGGWGGIPVPPVHRGQDTFPDAAGAPGGCSALSTVGVGWGLRSGAWGGGFGTRPQYWGGGGLAQGLGMGGGGKPPPGPSVPLQVAHKLSPQILTAMTAVSKSMVRRGVDKAVLVRRGGAYWRFAGESRGKGRAWGVGHEAARRMGGGTGLRARAGACGRRPRLFGHVAVEVRGTERRVARALTSTTNATRSFWGPCLCCACKRAPFPEDVKPVLWKSARRAGAVIACVRLSEYLWDLRDLRRRVSWVLMVPGNGSPAPHRPPPPPATEGRDGCSQSDARHTPCPPPANFWSHPAAFGGNPDDKPGRLVRCRAPGPQNRPVGCPTTAVGLPHNRRRFAPQPPSVCPTTAVGLPHNRRRWGPQRSAHGGYARYLFGGGLWSCLGGLRPSCDAGDLGSGMGAKKVCEPSQISIRVKGCRHRGQCGSVLSMSCVQSSHVAQCPHSSSTEREASMQIMQSCGGAEGGARGGGGGMRWNGKVLRGGPRGG